VPTDPINSDMMERQGRDEVWEKGGEEERERKRKEM
jgi:hypothetical protein